MRLSRLLSEIEGEWVSGKEERDILALNTDSRVKSEGSLFVCLAGSNSDSHEYAREAIRNGAVAILSERVLKVAVPQFIVADTRKALGEVASVFFGEPSKRLKVVGITGTNGKTTTAHMLAEIWRQEGRKVGVIGTLGIAYAGKSLPPTLTTPDPIALQETLADMLLRGVEYVVMEVSAHALFYKKTEGVHFSACIFTNFTQDHLDFFHTMKEYKCAKMRLFSLAACPLAVVNGDEEMGREIGKFRQREGGKTLFYGLNNPADSFAIITDETLYGTECMLNINDKLCRISLSMTGQHNVYNALAAAACAVEMGADAGAVSAGLTLLRGVKGRLEKVASYQGADVYVDFAHTSDGLEKSLESLKKYCKGRLICLFGCGGNRDKTKRPTMGEVAAKKTDFCVLTSDNPRYEDPLDIIADIEKGYRRFSSRYVVIPDRQKAIDYALDFLRKGDVLLIAGKGGEEYQEIMGIKYVFNDHTVVEELLERKGKNSFFKE